MTLDFKTFGRTAPRGWTPLLAVLMLANAVFGIELRAQTIAPVWSPPASFDALPSIETLPDLFATASGNRVRTIDDWLAGRARIKAMVQYYEYGRVPPRPDQVTAEFTARRPHSSGLGKEEWITLVIGSERKLRMRAVVHVPQAAGPRPVIIREEGTLGRTKQVPQFLEQGYIFVEYARHDLDPDQRNVVGPAQKAYPDYDWGTLAVWAWGGMRVVDYLESRSDVDTGRIGITGHSRGGKMALLAGALDERFALVVPNGSGAGGAGCYRVLGPGAESLGMNDKPHWYHERLRWFDGKEDRLPFDQHFLKALVAPRALLCTESLDDDFANPLGTQVTSMAADAVYRLYGAPSKNGLHYRRGSHDSNAEDWRALLSFAEWHFFSKEPQDPARFRQAPLPVPRQWLVPPDDWTAPAAVAGPDGGLSAPVKKSTGVTSAYVSVGDSGNPADRDYFDRGAFGAVSHPFEIGSGQVTNVQYANFLNAIAAEDSHGLYHAAMGARATGGITRGGGPGVYRYSVEEAMREQPVHFVSWYDALRYCNWLHNDMPTGPQDATTTEDGAYTFASTTAVGARNPDAKYFLPSEDEWYKAAYYVPDSTGAGRYCLFSGGGDQELSVPRLAAQWKSAYGVMGTANGTWEWNEAAVGKLFRGLRSGAWFLGNNRQAAGRFFTNPECELPNVGFRVARR